MYGGKEEVGAIIAGQQGRRLYEGNKNVTVFSLLQWGFDNAFTISYMKIALQFPSVIATI
jgi:hypothetical protein